MGGGGIGEGQTLACQPWTGGGGDTLSTAIIRDAEQEDASDGVQEGGDVLRGDAP